MKQTLQLILIFATIIYGIAGAVVVYQNLAHENSSKVIRSYQNCIEETSGDKEYCYSVNK